MDITKETWLSRNSPTRFACDLIAFSAFNLLAILLMLIVLDRGLAWIEHFSPKVLIELTEPARQTGRTMQRLADILNRLD